MQPIGDKITENLQFLLPISAAEAPYLNKLSNASSIHRAVIR